MNNPERPIPVESAGDGLTPQVQEAIQTDLAPGVAISMLAKADDPGEPGSPALKCMGAGLSAANDDGSVRIQFMFENGTVLPIDIPISACEALVRQLISELKLS